MNNLYMWLNLGSLAIPFLFSFHPKLRFYKKWPFLFPAIAMMMLFFIPWDVIFTTMKIWGFNPNYLTGTFIGNLPLEEWLFFICIPYACVFTHYALLYYFPGMQLSRKGTDVVYVILITTLLLLLLVFYNKWYPLVNFSYAIVLLATVYNTKKELLQTYFLTFLVMLVPFLIVNGVLTGSGIEQEIVWYDNTENLGLRLGTIPVEDSIYAFSMILTCTFLTEKFQDRNTQKKPTPKVAKGPFKES